MYERLMFWIDLVGRGASTPFFGRLLPEAE